MTILSELKPGIRWWRVIGGGLLIELGLMLVSAVLYGLGRVGDLQVVVPPLTLPIAFAAGWWVARPTARAVLNASLAGAIAIPLYLAIVVVAILAAPDQADSSAALSPAYLATHVIKVLGAGAGGWWVARNHAA